MPETRRYKGRCHCGNIELTFETATPPAEVRVRECDCSFCRKHGVRSIADPAARVSIRVARPEALARYRFGLKTADFLLCRDCGVYVAAVLEDEGERYATTNLNILEKEGAFTRRPLTISYEGESLEQRLGRRKRKWSPVTALSAEN